MYMTCVLNNLSSLWITVLNFILFFKLKNLTEATFKNIRNLGVFPIAHE